MTNKKQVIKKVPSKKVPIKSNGVKKPSAPVKPSSTGARVDSRNAAWQGFLDRNMMNFFMGLAIMIGSLLVFLQVFFWVPSEYQIPTSDDYRIVPLKSLGDPVYSDAEAGQHAFDTVSEFMTISRLDAKGHFQRMFQDKFTENGREVTASNLIKSGNWEQLKSGRYDTQFIPTSAPLLSDRRMTDGRYTWIFKMSGIWRWYDSATSRVYPNNVSITAFAIRESKLVNPDGMALDGLVIEVQKR